MKSRLAFSLQLSAFSLLLFSSAHAQPSSVSGGTGGLPVASQAEAEAGVSNVKSMTPLRTAQAIEALGAAGSSPAGSIGDAQIKGDPGFDSFTYGAGVQDFLITPTLANLNTALDTDALGAAADNTLSGNNTFSGTLTITGATVATPATMPSTEINVAKFWQTRSPSGSETWTFSATPATGWSSVVAVTAPGSDIVITHPLAGAIYAMDTGTSATTTTIPANATRYFIYRKESSRYTVSGTGVATVGSGAYALDQQVEVPMAGDTSMDIGNQARRLIKITGSGATINSFGTCAEGISVEGYFEGANTLTYNGTSMKLTTGATITTEAGDRFKAWSHGSGNWTVEYSRKSGQAMVRPNYILEAGGDSNPVINGTVAAASLFPGGARTIPAGIMGPKTTIRATLYGRMLNNSGSARGVTFTAIFGSTTLMTDSTTSTVIAADATERITQVILTLSNIDSTSSQYGVGSITIGTIDGASSGWGDFITSSAFGGTLHGASTEDTTTAKSLDLRIFTTGSDHASYTWTTYKYFIEVLNP